MWNGKLRYRLLELLAQFQVSIPATNPTGKWGATNRAAVKLVGVYELVASLEHEFAGIVGTAQEAVGRNGVGTGAGGTDGENALVFHFIVLWHRTHVPIPRVGHWIWLPGDGTRDIARTTYEKDDGAKRA